jgi:hypothetical protein
MLKSPAAILFDKLKNALTVSSEGGGVFSLFVRDEEVLSLLYAIHKEQKKTNMYLSQITDTIIEDEDLD